jgi:hypothetical protein
VEFASLPGENGDNLDIDYNEDGHFGIGGLTTSSNDKASLVGFVSRVLVVEELLVVGSDEPSILAEAECSPSWRKAMAEEMESIEDNQTRSLVDLAPVVGRSG